MTYEYNTNTDLRLPGQPEPHDCCEHVKPLLSALGMVLSDYLNDYLIKEARPDCVSVKAARKIIPIVRRSLGL